ncbi:hypothetical protein Acal01_01005 [Acinetobacter calcoaceticus]
MLGNAEKQYEISRSLELLQIILEFIFGCLDLNAIYNVILVNTGLFELC